jgi:GNAT superfamily N-acetyltransferase
MMDIKDNLEIIEYKEIVERFEYLGDIGYIAPYYLKTNKFNIIPFNKVSKNLRTLLINLLNLEFEKEFNQTYTEQFIRQKWSGIQVFYIITNFEQDKLIGSIAIDNKNHFPCISNLYILSEYRNQGYATYLLDYANKYIKSLGFEQSRLWCKDELLEFYKKKGWNFEKKFNNNNIMILNL